MKYRPNRNIQIHSRRTTVRLENATRTALEEIACREQRSISEICSVVSDWNKPKAGVTGEGEGTELPLTVAIGVFAMAYFRAGATDEGHAKAGHGELPPEP